MNDLGVITAGIPVNRDNCPVLTRVRAFIIDEGTTVTLEHTFHDRNGIRIELPDDTSSMSSESSPGSGSSSSSVSSDSSMSAPSTSPVVKLNVREVSNPLSPTICPPFTYSGTITSAPDGTVRVPLDDVKVTGQAGLYAASFGYEVDGKLLIVNNELISVERSLFGTGNTIRQHAEGPPTINEVRAQMWDTGKNDNLLLDDMEFSAEQVLQAILWPIQDFNSRPPPLSVQYTTINFPWRSHWISASIGMLHQFAAAFYRRNRLQGSAGGVNLDELNREQSYLTAYQMYINDWNAWRDAKKLEINMRACVGGIGSGYW